MFCRVRHHRLVLHGSLYSFVGRVFLELLGIGNFQHFCMMASQHIWVVRLRSNQFNILNHSINTIDHLESGFKPNFLFQDIRILIISVLS